MSSNLVRFGISIDKNLVDKFDKRNKGQGYKNRSEAIRDLIRESFISEEWEHNVEVAGGISIVYDHHRRDLLTKIMDIQHSFHDIIISTQHVHLSHTGCLEVLVVKGRADRIQCLYNKLKSTKGIDHISITKTSVKQIGNK